MERAKLERMSFDDLWSLPVEVTQLLQARIEAEKAELEQRLKALQSLPSGRRQYPTVHPKYRNPENPSETWAGRGKQPRWLTAQLRSGKRIDDFRVQKAARH